MTGSGFFMLSNLEREHMYYISELNFSLLFHICIKAKLYVFTPYQQFIMYMFVLFALEQKLYMRTLGKYSFDNGELFALEQKLYMYTLCGTGCGTKCGFALEQKLYMCTPAYWRMFLQY